uniref:Peptidase_M13 domain-containing protein n=1 Tax=Parastrongyloides trichosuri TaxID=131310 RepID=A0A0N4ZDE9_PARTI
MNIIYLFILFSFIHSQNPGSLYRNLPNVDFNLARELLLETIDTTISPCDDFYAFACGKWIYNEKQPRPGKRLLREKRTMERVEKKFYEKLLSSDPPNYKATWKIREVIRICAEERYKKEQLQIDIQTAYRKCIAENLLFGSYAYITITLNTMFSQKQITELYEVITDMFEMLKYEFNKLAIEKRWLDYESIRKIKYKLNELSAVMVYNSKDFSIVEMEKVYDELKFHDNTPYQELKKIVQDFIERKNRDNENIFNDKLGNPLNTLGRYHIGNNIFYIYLGLLTEPTFTLTLPTAMMFGGYGSIMGHEIVHGFDEMGLNFTKRSTREDLFSKFSMKEYNKRRQCIINRYNIEKLLDLNIDGARTLEENIADHGGVKIAYRAFKRFIKENKIPDQKISGLEYLSSDQIFFISFFK